MTSHREKEKDEKSAFWHQTGITHFVRLSISVSLRLESLSQTELNLLKQCSFALFPGLLFNIRSYIRANGNESISMQLLLRRGCVKPSEKPKAWKKGRRGKLVVRGELDASSCREFVAK